jgi:hypothetical protein
MGGGAGVGPTDLANVPGHLIADHQALMEGSGSWETTDGSWSTTLAGGGILQHLDAAILAGTPWDTVEAYDPTEDLALIDAEFAVFRTAVAALDPAEDWADFSDMALAIADGILEDGGSEELGVEAFTEDAKEDFARELAVVRATLFANNASEGSALPMMMAILRRGFLGKILTYRMQLRRDLAAARATFVAQGISEMQQAQRFKIEAQRLASIIRNELRVVAINAFREQKNETLEYAQKKQTFRLGLFAAPFNGLAGYSGATSIPQGPSKLSTALSTALSGAATGVSVGAQGGPGTAVLGGFVGGLLGFASGRT